LELEGDKHLGRNMDGEDTKHSQLAVLVVPLEVRAVVVLGTTVVLGDPHDAKIVKRGPEHCRKVVMKLGVFPQMVAHERDNRTGVAPRIPRSGDQRREGFRIVGWGFQGSKLFSAVQHSDGQVCVKMCVRYEPPNGAKFHVDAQTKKAILAAVAKGQEYHETKNDNSMNVSVLRYV